MCIGKVNRVESPALSNFHTLPQATNQHSLFVLIKEQTMLALSTKKIQRILRNKKCDIPLATIIEHCRKLFLLTQVKVII